MADIGGLLENFKKGLFPKMSQKVLVVSIIKKHSNIELHIDLIELKNKKLLIKVFGIEKQEIISKQDKILLDLRNNNIFIDIIS